MDVLGEDSNKKFNFDEQFLFRDEEFEDNEFDAAQFVARYRRVTSLESLREQLVGYNQHVQKQLYSIINRDYKDFITITTKLDGLDTRAEMMMKPLFGLQMDMSSLQNGVSGSLHLIQDKLDEQKEILRKKATIQKLLRVSSNMDLAKSALNMSTSSNSTKVNNGKSIDINNINAANNANNSRRNRLYRHSQHQIDSQDKDLFVCSEYERAAIALRESQEDLMVIAENITALQNTTVSVSMLQELQRNFEITKDNLVANVKTHLEHYFSSAATEKRSLNTATNGVENNSIVSSNSANNGNNNVQHAHGTISPIQLRCYGHCLRAVLSLGRGDIAEIALRSAVIEPYVKNAFSVGKIDGKLGRGSYSGLDGSLQDMIGWIEQSHLPHLLVLAEEITMMMTPTTMTHTNSNSSNSNNTEKKVFNLVLHSIWEPVLHILQERFPTMISVGITPVFSHCFRAIDRFAHYWLQHYPTTGQRGFHAFLDRYYKTWKLDLYFQLRSREIMTRLDAICEQQLPANANANTPNKAANTSTTNSNNKQKGDLWTLAYTPATATATAAVAPSATGKNTETEPSSSPSSSSSSLSATTTLKNRLQTPLTLDAAVLAQVWQELAQLIAATALHPSPTPTTNTNGSNNNNSSSNNGKSSSLYHHEIYQALSMELSLVTHPQVALQPILTQCLGLSVRLIQRVVYHIVLLCNASSFPLQTTSATNANGTVSNSPLSLEEDTTTTTANANSNTNTANSNQQSFEQLRIAYLGADNAAAFSTASLSMEELLGHWQDLLHFHCFAQQFLNNQCLPRLNIHHHPDHHPDLPTSTTTNASENQQQGSNTTTNAFVTKALLPVLTAAEAIWQRMVSLLAQDCKRSLNASVKAIAGKYRMTNKPPPTNASPFVSTILEPLEGFLLRYKYAPDVLMHHHIRLTTTTTTNTSTRPEDTTSKSNVVMNVTGHKNWKELLLEDITQAYAEQIVTLFETVRQMDSALQRRQQQRTKNTAATGAAGAADNSATNSLSSGNQNNAVLTDSDKIYLQVKLDVQEYGVLCQRILFHNPNNNNGSSNSSNSNGSSVAQVEELVPAYRALVSTVTTSCSTTNNNSSTASASVSINATN